MGNALSCSWQRWQRWQRWAALRWVVDDETPRHRLGLWRCARFWCPELGRSGPPLVGESCCVASPLHIVVTLQQPTSPSQHLTDNNFRRFVFRATLYISQTHSCDNPASYSLAVRTPLSLRPLSVNKQQKRSLCLTVTLPPLPRPATLVIPSERAATTPAFLEYVSSNFFLKRNATNRQHERLSRHAGWYLRSRPYSVSTTTVDELWAQRLTGRILGSSTSCKMFSRLLVSTTPSIFPRLSS